MVDDALTTPLFRVLDDVYLKCEFLHPGRSHKARVARALIDDGEVRGEISPRRHRVLLERTGGNLGIALALEAQARGYRLTLVTDPHYARLKKEIAARLGAVVVDRGVAYPQCRTNREVIDLLIAADPSKYHYLNQFANQANPRAHERGTGAEILAQLITRGHARATTVVLVKGLGTGASMSGIHTVLRTWFERVVTLAIQPPGCDLLAGEYAEHSIQGIAVGEAPPFFDVSKLDGVIPVTDAEVVGARTALIRDHRLLVGPSSCANFAALARAREHPAAQVGGPRIFVTLLYDRGEDYE